MVQALDHGFLQRKLLLEFHVMAGYDNCIVNIRTHLDSADDQIGQEEKVAVAERRHREVAPDTALDDQDQQYRQAAGPEGEQQHQDYKRNRQNADEQIIMLKGGTEVEELVVSPTR